MSELRQDLVGGNWILLASERAKRPHELVKKKPARKPTPVSKCPFDNLRATGNWPPVVLSPDDEKKWEIAIIENKYPALRHRDACASIFSRGPYKVAEGIGKHELIITKNHAAHAGFLPLPKAIRLFTELQKHYDRLSQDPCVVYTATFFNWGQTAGASVYHPHYQVISLPILPPHIHRSLEGSQKYFREHGECVHCKIIAAEKRGKSRIIAENAGAIAFMPFASKYPFQITLFPKKHTPDFRSTTAADMRNLVALFQRVNLIMKKKLHDPDFNFYLHTTPFRGENYEHYHWHIELVPKISVEAGFELSTGVDINVVDPDVAAAFFRK